MKGKFDDVEDEVKEIVAAKMKLDIASWSMKREPLPDYRVYLTLDKGKVDVEAYELRPIEKEKPIEKESREPEEFILRVKKSK